MKFHFDAPVLRTESGMINHYLPVPDEVADAFRKKGIRRSLEVARKLRTNTLHGDRKR